MAPPPMHPCPPPPPRAPFKRLCFGAFGAIDPCSCLLCTAFLALPLLPLFVCCILGPCTTAMASMLMKWKKPHVSLAFVVCWCFFPPLLALTISPKIRFGTSRNSAPQGEGSWGGPDTPHPPWTPPPLKGTLPVC